MFPFPIYFLTSLLYMRLAAWSLLAPAEDVNLKNGSQISILIFQKSDISKTADSVVFHMSCSNKGKACICLNLPLKHCSFTFSSL